MKNYILTTLLMISSVAINGMEDEHFLDNLALLGAAKYGNSDTVKRCIASNADVNHMDEDGNTALMEAASRKETENCVLLIAHKANIYHMNSKGETPLTNAAKNYYQAKTCELLIARMISDRVLSDEFKENICIVLGCLKHKRTPLINTGLNYHMMRDVMSTHYNPAFLVTQSICSPKIRIEIEKIQDNLLKAYLLEKYCNQ